MFPPVRHTTISFLDSVLKLKCIKSAHLHSFCSGTPTQTVISGNLDPEESYYPLSHSNQDLNKISTSHKRRNASNLEGLRLRYSRHLVWRRRQEMQVIRTPDCCCNQKMDGVCTDPVNLQPDPFLEVKPALIPLPHCDSIILGASNLDRNPL